MLSICNVYVLVFMVLEYNEWIFKSGSEKENGDSGRVEKSLENSFIHSFIYTCTKYTEVTASVIEQVNNTI